jgi:hypothetical protein
MLLLHPLDRSGDLQARRSTVVEQLEPRRRPRSVAHQRCRSPFQAACMRWPMPSPVQQLVGAPPD